MEAAARTAFEGIQHGGAFAVPIPWGAKPAGRLPVMSDSSPERRFSEDADLVSRVLEGDEGACVELVSRFKQKVLGTASRFARNAHDLDDLAQDIFLRVWRGLGKYRAEAPLEHWVMRVAVRTCYDSLRRNRKRRENEVLVEEAGDRESDEGAVETRRRREAWEVIRAGMEHLAAKERTILTLLELEEHSVAEVAGLTGWSESNVKVRAFRARNKLREVLQRKGYGYE